MADLKKIWIGQDFQGLKIKNIAAPVDSTDPATKGSAQAQADAAKQQAIDTAAQDATQKANAAQQAAIDAAAIDATTKANAAVQTAAQDATTKATTAETNAKTYADGIKDSILNNAGPAYDTLLEIQQILQGQDASVTTILDTLSLKTNKFAGNITGTPTPVGGDYEYLVQHNLNKADVIAQAFDGNDQVDVFIRKVDNNSLKVITGVALGSTTLRVVVVG